MLLNVDDMPADAPEFGFGRLARSLALMLQQERNAAFVLGLHGPWGAGKTTLLNAIKREITDDPLIIDFNAWKYQDKEVLWRALILRVLEAVRAQTRDVAKVKEVERSLYEGFAVKEQGALQVNWTSAVTVGIQAAIGLAAVGVGGGAVASAALAFGKFFGLKKEPDAKSEDIAKQVERVGGILERKTVERSIRQVASIEQFVELFRELIDSLGNKRRVYVFIDDLDRCLPETALGIFEAVKLFLDSKKCAYVVAVDRAVIRRGLELRYPSKERADARTLPPTVDPDEYIEKTITLSVDLPMLADADGRALLTPEGEDTLSPTEKNAIIAVLGTNPRRLKRFGAVLALWREVARTLHEEGMPGLGFSPMNAQDRELFLKLSLIGYLNSAVLGEMRRDSTLPQRLQDACSAALSGGEWKSDASKQISDKMKDELPVIAQASLDAALWRAFRLEPSLSAPAIKERVPLALRWFRSAAT